MRPNFTQKIRTISLKKLGSVSAARFVFIMFFTVMMAGGRVNACPADPTPHEFTQPNSQVITTVNKGDEFLSWTEDLDGDLLVKVGDAYYYAEWTDDGPKATTTLASDRITSHPGSKGSEIPDSIREEAANLSEEYTTELQASTFDNASGLTDDAPGVNQNPQRKVLIIYVTYNSDPVVGSGLASNLKMTTDSIYNLVFGGSGTGSVNDYYMKTLGTSTNVIVPATGAGITNGVINVNLAGNHPNANSDTNGRRAMMSAAMNQAIAQGFNLSSFAGSDNYLSRDELVIGFIFQGYESSISSAGSGSGSPSFWGSAWYGETYSGVTIEGCFAQGSIHIDHPLTIGVICHELGHAGYGFKDTYDYDQYIGDGRSQGMGYWSLMSVGSWGYKSGEYSGKTPVYPDAFNLVISGLVTPETISYNEYSTEVATDHCQIYKIVPKGNTSQYFLLQQRKNTGFDAGAFYQMGSTSSTAGGLMIYHIDPSVTLPRFNDKNTHYMAGVEEAHGGAFHLQQVGGTNYGKTDDLFGNGYNTFSMLTSPSSGLYSAFTNNTVSPTQTADSGVTIRNISYSASAGQTQFTIGESSRNTATVTGLVWPFISDVRFGNSFPKKHEIVVELRPTFNTPASAYLRTTAVATAIDGEGRFTIENVPFGTYVLYIDRAGWLIRTMMVTISASDPDIIELSPPGAESVFELIWGDSNNDLVVDARDVDYVVAMKNIDVFNPGYIAACDFNADGIIDAGDISLVVGNKGKTALDYAGASNVDFNT